MARNKKVKMPAISTIIDHDTVVVGNLQFTGGLHLDGRVEGNVVARDGGAGTLVISQKGDVEGEIRVTNLMLDGAVVGDVHVSGRVELAPKARITGNLYYHLLEMAMGAEVNGKLVRVDENAQPPPPQPKQKSE